MNISKKKPLKWDEFDIKNMFCRWFTRNNNYGSFTFFFSRNFPVVKVTRRWGVKGRGWCQRCAQTTLRKLVFPNRQTTYLYWEKKPFDIITGTTCKCNRTYYYLDWNHLLILSEDGHAFSGGRLLDRMYT